MLGATSTILYGLNIILDPKHEPLEYEPDAPGITKVTLAFTSTQLLRVCQIKGVLLLFRAVASQFHGEVKRP